MDPRHTWIDWVCRSCAQRLGVRSGNNFHSEQRLRIKVLAGGGVEIFCPYCQASNRLDAPTSDEG